MNPVESAVENVQELIAQVPEVLQPVIVMLAAAIPFIEGEGGAVVGIVGGLHPVVAAVAAAAGNFLSVLLVVALASRARTAVVDRHRSPVGVGGVGAGPDSYESAAQQTPGTKPESKGRQRFNRWLVRYGVPGASLLGPLAIPTQFMAAALVGSGIPARRVLLWQAIGIALWTTVATVGAWAALTYVVGS